MCMMRVVFQAMRSTQSHLYTYSAHTDVPLLVGALNFYRTAYLVVRSKPFVVPLYAMYFKTVVANHETDIRWTQLRINTNKTQLRRTHTSTSLHRWHIKSYSKGNKKYTKFQRKSDNKNVFSRLQNSFLDSLWILLTQTHFARTRILAHTGPERERESDWERKRAFWKTCIHANSHEKEKLNYILPFDEIEWPILCILWH